MKRCLSSTMSAWVAFTLLGLLFAPIALSKQSDKPLADNSKAVVDKIDRYLLQLVEKEFSGSVLVLHHGRKLLSRGYGLSDRENGYHNAPDTVFDIMSVTKSFTGAAVLKLQMAGKLRLTDTLGKYFSNFSADKSHITLHQLLTHTAGLPEVLGQDYEPITQADFLRKVATTELHFEPGTYYAYSNVGYSLLAMVVEQVAGMSYEQWLNRTLFKPAGMTRTGYVLPRYKERDVAVGYGAADWGRPNQKPWQADGPFWHLKGNGGLLSTVEDLHLWFVALQGNRVLSEEAKTLYFTPSGKPRWRSSRPSSYGYGWAIDKAPWDKQIINHTGGNPGMSSDVSFYLDTQSAIVVLSNTRDGFSYEVSRAIEGILFKPGYQPKEKSHYRSLAARLEQGLNGEQIIAWIKAGGADLNDYIIDEATLNTLGYFFVEKQQLNQALAVFQFNTEYAPESGNVWDSYGETLLEAGQREAGLAAYRRALLVDPEYGNADYARKLVGADLQ